MTVKQCPCNTLFSKIVGAPTQRLVESQLTIVCKLAGPQHRGWRKVSLQ
ncbi:predicted protein [Staphylococcus aureus A9754]|nr:predicted protein [Staphylococcus aureus A9754]